MMQDYKKLVEALRCCAGVHTKPTKCPDYDDSWCGGNCLDNHLIAAADAIEALHAAEPTEKQVVDYCHKRCLVVLGADLFHELKASYGKTPKRGEWIRVQEVDIPGEMRPAAFKCMCSMCRNEYLFPRIPRYCPDCGSMNTAKTEVRDG